MDKVSTLRAQQMDFYAAEYERLKSVPHEKRDTIAMALNMIAVLVFQNRSTEAGLDDFRRQLSKFIDEEVQGKKSTYGIASVQAIKATGIIIAGAGALLGLGGLAKGMNNLRDITYSVSTFGSTVQSGGGILEEQYIGKRVMSEHGETKFKRTQSDVDQSYQHTVQTNEQLIRSGQSLDQAEHEAKNAISSQG